MRSDATWCSWLKMKRAGLPSCNCKANQCALLQTKAAPTPTGKQAAQALPLPCLPLYEQPPSLVPHLSGGCNRKMCTVPWSEATHSSSGCSAGGENARQQIAAGVVPLLRAAQ